MAYVLWGQGSQQYPFLGTTAENLHFFRPRQSAGNSMGMLGIALTDAASFVLNGVNTVTFQAVAFDQLLNVEGFESPTQDAINTVVTDFLYFQPLQFSTPSNMSTARAAGFVWVEMNGANYEIHYQAATYTPFNIEWTYSGTTGTTPAPEPMVLSGTEISLLTGIVDISEVQVASHIDDVTAANRDMLVAWEVDNGDGTYDAFARRFLPDGSSGGSQFLLIDNLVPERGWTLINSRSGLDFSLAIEGRDGGSNPTVSLQNVTAAGVFTNVWATPYVVTGGASDIATLQTRFIGGAAGTNTAVIFYSLVGGVVSARTDVVDASGAQVSTNSYATSYTSFADIGSIVLSGGYNAVSGISTRVALAYQDSATHWTVQVLDATSYAQLATFGGNGVFDRIVTNRVNGVDRLTVTFRDDFDNAANALDFVVYYDDTQSGPLTGTVNTDIIPGTAGNDTILGLDGSDKLAGGAGDDSIDGGTGRDMLDGWAGNDTLIGGTGNDVLDGGIGVDSMTGGTDNDTYYVDNAGDLVIENATEGLDDVVSYLASYTLPTNVENLRFDGSGNFGGNGNGNDNFISSREGNDTLYGGGGIDTLNSQDGNDVLDGGSGADFMFGGNGADIYYVDNAGDQVNDTGSPDVDTVFFTNVAGATLSANVEYGYSLGTTGSLTGNTSDNVLIGGYATVAQTLTGNDGNDFLSGTAAPDIIYGGTGVDTLLGRGGGDQLFGGDGNDNYYVESLSDVVTENAGATAGANDIMYTNVNATMSANVETLFTYGAATNVTGNADANAMLGVYSTVGVTLNGLAGNDILYGSGRADVLNGGADNDTFFGSAGGPDTFADAMNGSTGNDTYFVQEASDAVTENAGEGTADTVYAALNYTLGANVETLFIYGAATTATGNSAANTLIGSYIATGVTLDGGGGGDVLIGGGGNDTFRFAVGQGGGDTVQNFAGNGAAAGDALLFAGYGAGATFTQVGATNQWVITYNGGANTETITFSNAAAIDVSDYQFV